MEELRIIFTGAGRRVELIQAFRQAALVLNKKMKIYGADMTADAPALAYCDYTRLVCGMKEKGYIQELIRICEEDHIRLLIPTIDTDLQVLSENRERFKKVGVKVLVSAPEMIRICRDKKVTARFFTKCGLKTPIPVENWEAYQGGYPAFIKPRDGSSSINAFKVSSEGELQVYASKMEEYIVQPFIQGKEYTIDIFCDFEGNPVSVVPRERLQVRAGEVLKTRICMDEVMIAEAKKLCEIFRPCGPLTVQLIRDGSTGDDFYIEINPRFGGGAPLSMKAGSGSAEAVLKLLDGERADTHSQITDGTVYSRFDQSVCVSGGEQVSLKGIIFDLDDTLYSEKEYVKSGYRAVAEYLGSEEIFERLWRFFQEGKPAIDELMKELGRETERLDVLSIYRSHKPDIYLYDGVAEMLTALKKKGIKTGIITDGRPEGQRNKMKALGLEDLVDDIIITDELGGSQFRKPCDIAFRIMQNRWRIPMSQIAYAGDNLAKDFQAPQQLGMQSIYFRNGDGVYGEEGKLK